MSEVLNVEEIFGSKVFTLGKMRERLPKSVYKEVKKIIDHGGELSLATADVVAKAMKDWAIENGATHYTPLVPASDRYHRREARCIRNPSR